VGTWPKKSQAVVALILSIGVAMLYLPFSPAALLWPNEWLIVLGWSALGVLLMRNAETGVRR
jgi:hypothetical protein